MWMKKLMMVCLTVVAFSGCEKKQHDAEVVLNPLQAAIVLIGQGSWRFVIFEQRQGGDFFPVYAARPHLPTELSKGGEDSSIEAPQEMIL